MAFKETLCIVFILTLLGEIRANVDSDASTRPKQVYMHEMMPPSLLYLLQHRPIKHPKPPSSAKPDLPIPATPPTSPQKLTSSNSFYPILPSASVPPTAPVAPTPPLPPASPSAPVPPTPPVSPTAPVPPTPPKAPEAPVAFTNPEDPSPKHKYSHQVLPPSLMYLLHHRPIRHPRPSQRVPSTPPTAPQSSKSPQIPYSALYPSAPSVSAPPKPPASPALDRPHVQVWKPEFSAPFPGQLSYDNPSNGNRKLLNVVHIPLRRTVDKPQPAPLGATPFNNIESDNVPFGPTPISPQGSTISKPEDLFPEPIDNIRGSPIPARPLVSKEGSNDSKNTFTVNPKDLPIQTVDNIEASPIPVRPKDNTTSETEETTSPKKTGNSEDLSPEPVNTLEVSPIPDKPNEIAIEDTSNFNDSPQKPTTEVVSSTTDKVDQDKVTQNDFEDSKTTPNQESKEETKSDENIASEENVSSNSNDSNSEKTALEEKHETEKELPKETHEPQNPLKDFTLNGTSPDGQDNKNTEEKDNSTDNPLKDPTVHDTTLNKNEKDAGALPDESQSESVQQESGDAQPEPSKDSTKESDLSQEANSAQEANSDNEQNNEASTKESESSGNEENSKVASNESNSCEEENHQSADKAVDGESSKEAVPSSGEAKTDIQPVEDEEKH